MAFRVGQKVVCVDGTPDYYDPEPSINPVTNGIYTVANVYVVDGDTMLELIEVPHPESDEFYAGFAVEFFRPVVEKSTDTGMAILREILDRETIKDRAPVRQH